MNGRKDIVFSCPYCDKEYHGNIGKHNLMRHIKIIHQRFPPAPLTATKKKTEHKTISFTLNTTIKIMDMYGGVPTSVVIWGNTYVLEDNQVKVLNGSYTVLRS